MPCGLIEMYYANVNNQTLTQVSLLYVHVPFCLILPTGSHGHVFCMGDMVLP